MVCTRNGVFVFHKVDITKLEEDIWSVGCENDLDDYRVIPDSSEYYNPENYMIKPKNGYFAPPPIDQTEAFRNTLGDVLTKLGVSS